MANPIETTGSNPGNIPFEGAKKPLTDADIQQKIAVSDTGEFGDDTDSEKYKKEVKKEKDRGPNFDLSSDQEDGDTSVNAGVFK